jgi:hypothetical protein
MKPSSAELAGGGMLGQSASEPRNYYRVACGAHAERFMRPRFEDRSPPTVPRLEGLEQARAVREWLKSLDATDRRVIGEDIKDVVFSWPIGMPLVRSLGREIWEVRSSLPHSRIARVLFCVEREWSSCTAS